MTLPQGAVEHQDEMSAVSALAEQLLIYLASIESEIDAAHRPDAKSKKIQDLVGSWLREQQFEEEYLHAFLETEKARSRPDFFRDLGQGRGILAEIERGGAVNNNHDLKDVWKCHLSEKSQHLFLLVPNRNFKRDGSRREAPFLRSKARLSTFFQSSRTHVDMLSLSLFGYGPEVLAPGEPPPEDVVDDDDE
jgi:hypothetical protein